MGNGLKILVVGHNLGNTLFSMGGTISSFQKRGDEVKVLSVIANEISDKTRFSNDHEQSVGILGASHECLFTQSRISDRRDLRDLLMDRIREFDPTILIVPSPDSYDVSDRNLYTVAFGSSYSACVPNYPSPEGLQATKARCPIFRMDFGDVGMNRSLQYVDVSDHWEKKIQAIDSLADTMNCQKTANLKNTSDIVGRARGVQIQKEFAEAFETENAWGRLSASRLLP